MLHSAFATQLAETGPMAIKMSDRKKSDRTASFIFKSNHLVFIEHFHFNNMVSSWTAEPDMQPDLIRQPQRIDLGFNLIILLPEITGLMKTTVIRN